MLDLWEQPGKREFQRKCSYCSLGWMSTSVRARGRIYIYKMQSSFGSRKKLLMTMEKLFTRYSSILCADKRQD